MAIRTIIPVLGLEIKGVGRPSQTYVELARAVSTKVHHLVYLQQQQHSRLFSSGIFWIFGILLFITVLPTCLFLSFVFTLLLPRYADFYPLNLEIHSLSFLGDIPHNFGGYV